MNKHILEIIADIFKKHFMISPQWISYRHSFQKDFSLNEYELNEMLLYVEAQLHVDMKEYDAKSFRTIGDLVHCVENCRK